MVSSHSAIRQSNVNPFPIRVNPMSIYHQSAKPMSILDQSTNLMSIHHQSMSIQCQPITEPPIQCQSWTNPTIHQQAIIHHQSVNQSLIRQSIINLLPSKCLPIPISSSDNSSPILPILPILCRSDTDPTIEVPICFQFSANLMSIQSQSMPILCPSIPNQILCQSDVNPANPSPIQYQ